MLTHSGVFVAPTSPDAPPLVDVAVSLGRMPRFGGHYRVYWWTVLHHSLACAQYGVDHYSERIGALMLLHDAHESATGDIPTFWKSDDMRERQAALDRRIFAALHYPPPTEEEAAIVRHVDELALHAEGFYLGPTGWAEFYPDVRPSCSMMGAVESVLDDFPNPGDTLGTDSRAVKTFLTFWDSLRHGLKSP